jgi:hypothetical protein
MILPLPAFGSIQYFAQLTQAKGPIKFAINETVDRRNKRNRYKTVDDNGTKLNSIPIYKPRDRKYLSQVIIANEEDWQRDHWRNLVTSYNSSPFFEFYDYKFQELFTKEFTNLLEFNKATLDIAMSVLKIKVDYRFIDETQEPITLIETKKYEEYQQVFSPKLSFQKNSSILDLIFNLGPDSNSYLETLAFSSE